MMTCQCNSTRPRLTFTMNPTTQESLFLCSLHAKMHREGHAFPVQPYTEVE